MIYPFCPQCGEDLKKRKAKELKKSSWKCPNCNTVFYQNSKPCVGVLVIKEQEVLLVQRADEPFKDYWDIPGGFLEFGEHPYDGAIREIQEETGLVVEPVEILDIFMDEYGEEKKSTLNICYIAKVTAGELNPTSDIKDAKWASIKSLPDNIAFAWSKKALTLLKKRLLGNQVNM